MEGHRFHKNSDSDKVNGGPKGKSTIFIAAKFWVATSLPRSKDRTQSPQALIGFGIGFGGHGILGFGFKTHAHSILTGMWLMR
ncbi:hypothetical protein CFP56_021740 [Quercus suber]|uniref:Uncharacterized protein n=1 Tax=Quercus suber TaxID=58331 RepID=A0AAW0KCD0_QUESU